MTRMKILGPEHMKEDQRAAYEAAVEAGRPHAGPYWALVRQPGLMKLCSDMGEWFRGCKLSPRERQIAVLTVIRHWSARYPWAVQVRNSLAAGVDDFVIDSINNRRDPGLNDARERMAHEVAFQLAQTCHLTDETYAEAEKLFGEEDLVALIGAIGYFGMVCATANAIDASPPDDAPARLI